MNRYTLILILSMSFIFEINGQIKPFLHVESDSSVLEFNTYNQSGLSYPLFSQLTMKENFTDQIYGTQSLVGLNFIRRAQYNDEPTLEFAYPNSEGINRNFAFRIAGQAKLFLQGNGYLGLGTSTPKSTLHIADGDIYLEEIQTGIILKSPNNQCWRVTASNEGDLILESIICPN